MGSGTAFCAITVLLLPPRTFPCSSFGSTVLQNFNMNPKMFYVGRGNLIASTSAIGKGDFLLDHVSQSPIQSGLEHFQGCDNLATSEDFFKCLTILISKNFFLMPDLNLLSFGVKTFPGVHCLSLQKLFKIRFASFF